MERNTRPLRAANGAFHLGKVALEAGLTLCDFCDRRGKDCDRELTEEGCDQLVPALFFLDRTGLEGAFSTFRPSAVLYERARALYRTHKTVALVDSETGETFGRAKITDAHKGPFWALMEAHAWSNHLMLAQDVPLEEAPSRLTAWVARNMGSRYAKDRDGICTILYLERIAT